MEGKKTVDQMCQSMKDSMRFIESRFGFITDNFPCKDGKEVKMMLKDVKTFIDSPQGKQYFQQWIDYALIFENSLNKVKFLAEKAVKEYNIDPNNNPSLAEARTILEDLDVRIKATEGSK